MSYPLTRGIKKKKSDYLQIASRPQLSRLLGLPVCKHTPVTGPGLLTAPWKTQVIAVCLHPQAVKVYSGSGASVIKMYFILY